MVINEKVDTNRRGFLKSVAAMALAPALPVELLQDQPVGGLSWDEMWQMPGKPSRRVWQMHGKSSRLGYPDVWFGLGHRDPTVLVIHVEGLDAGEIGPSSN